MNTVEYGPLQESGMITGGLDYYKPTMSQFLGEYEPGIEDTFTFKNRGEQRIADYVAFTDLQARFDDIAERGFQEKEIDYFKTLKNDDDERVFTDTFLEHLQEADLPPVRVTFDEETNDIAIETMGPAEMATFWETVVMSEVNEAYFEGYVRAHDINIMDVYDEGDRRLSEKIAILQQNPDIKFSEFGTRRHFSLRWQKHVLGRLNNECPENLVGTSNVALANTTETAPIGTYAHELPMIYAGLAAARGKDVRASHHQLLEDWYGKYGKELSIALPDTFGSDFFFAEFTPEQAEKWRSLRHDSGNPDNFGERVIDFYENLGIDPMSKTIVFSDGLDMKDILHLHQQFAGRINVAFGWGTSLTNDLGLKPLNIVMKVTHVRTAEGQEADTVKLSDDAGKHTGPAGLAETYANQYFAIKEEQYSGTTA